MWFLPVNILFGERIRVVDARRIELVPSPPRSATKSKPTSYPAQPFGPKRTLKLEPLPKPGDQISQRNQPSPPSNPIKPIDYLYNKFPQTHKTHKSPQNPAHPPPPTSLNFQKIQNMHLDLKATSNHNISDLKAPAQSRIDISSPEDTLQDHKEDFPSNWQFLQNNKAGLSYTPLEQLEKEKQEGDSYYIKELYPQALKCYEKCINMLNAVEREASVSERVRLEEKKCMLVSNAAYCCGYIGGMEVWNKEEALWTQLIALGEQAKGYVRRANCRVFLNKLHMAKSDLQNALLINPGNLLVQKRLQNLVKLMEEKE